LKKYRDIPDRQRTCSGVHAALGAARSGRVHQLCIAEGADVKGPMPGPMPHRGKYGDEDLANAAIVETLRHGGEIFLLPPDSMPPDTVAAAILRY
jgi:hypothetical protein